MPAKTQPMDFALRAFGPAARFNEVVAGNVERAARFQFAIAGDLMQLAIDQMNAGMKARDVPTLLASQREIGTKFAEKAAERQQEFTQLAADSQASFAALIEDVTSIAGGKAA